MKKRIITVLLILTMVLSFFATTAFASIGETPAPTETPAATTGPAEPTTPPVVQSALPLQMGSTGDLVIKLQNYLIANSYQVTSTGTYDEATQAAVSQYQAAVGYEVTGVADEKTFGRLEAVENFLAIASSKLGCRYVSGGKGPSKFDCSGFVYWSLNQAGVKQTYLSSRYWPSCKAYTKITKITQMIRGDVICFKGHMAIYLGRGQLINASSSNHKVATRADVLTSRYWKKNFRCAFRVF